MGSDDKPSKSGNMCKSSSSRCKVKRKVKSKVMRRLSVKSKSRRVKSLSMKSSSSTGQFSVMKENVKSDKKMLDVSSCSKLDSSNSSRILGNRSQSSCYKVKRQVKVQRGVSVVKVKVKKIRSLKSSSNNVLTEKSITGNANNSNSNLLARSINDVSAGSSLDAACFPKKSTDRVSENVSTSPTVKKRSVFSKFSTKVSTSVTGKDKPASSAPTPAAQEKKQYHNSLLYTCLEFYDCPYGFKHADFEPYLVGNKSFVNIRKAVDLDKVVIIDANGEVEVASPVPATDKVA